ncbi:hypothetical protein EXU85_03650 [Spirosoma sp. KCTC 42546]|uniref:hypothetical protein n=1 Tax=Spirosoma sp. KCTC 42546 TaxID=2520506 RepID=UPI001157722C|nr:hypothetical protein [Spirosoma sp. KCTC 42546]QDK77737.1 hypothetical protein EXU85_03650 [Spirosoma sp. KCTC 42546]
MKHFLYKNHSKFYKMREYIFGIMLGLIFFNQQTLGKFKQDPVYDKIRNSINIYRKASTWNEQNYNLIRVQINTATTNQQLNATQQKELLALAQQEYVLSLSSTASSFLRTAGSDALPRLAAFENAISRISASSSSAASALKGVSAGIGDFRQMVSLRNAVLGYTHNAKYNPAQTNNLRSQMNQLLSGNLLTGNTFLTKLRSEYSNELNTHIEKHRYFYEVVKPDADKGVASNCEVFSQYKFYYKSCHEGQPKPAVSPVMAKDSATTKDTTIIKK